MLADLEAIAAARGRGVLDPAVVVGLHDRRQALTEPAFVGRAAELAVLTGLLDQARRGRGLVLLEVTWALEDSGFDPNLLTLEITESATAEDTEATIARLEELKALGIRLPIDDFGTGHSSLSYLAGSLSTSSRSTAPSSPGSARTSRTRPSSRASSGWPTPSASRPWPRASRAWTSSSR